MIIDFSSQEGLVNRFFGDYPYNVAQPQLSMNGGPSQYASGVVNPLSQYGYLTPANGTYIVVNNDTTGGRAISTATAVDEVNSFLFIYDNGGVLRRTTSLTQTAITATTVSVASTAGTDLEFYSEAGFRKLFFAYKNTGSLTGDIGVWDTTGISGNNKDGTRIFLSYSANAATFVTGDTITGSTSGATGHISGNRYTGASGGTLFLSSVTGTFVNAETITDQHANTGTTFITGGGNAIGSSVNPTFMSSFVSGGVTTSGGNVRMIVADNGFMYILDTSFVHKYDGGTTQTNSAIIDKTATAFGILTPNVLIFPPGFTLTDGIDYRGKIWITLFQSTRDIFAASTNTGIYANYCGVYVWDRITAGSSTQDFISLPGVREIRAIVTFQGVPALFDVSDTRYAELRMWNGTQFKLVAQLGQEAYPRYHDSIVVNGDMLSWLGNDGKMYYYGMMNPGFKNALYCLGDSTTKISGGSTFQNSGAIALANDSESSSGSFNLTPEAYYISLLDNTAAKILKWYPHAQLPAGNTQNAAVGNYYTMVKPLPKLSQTHFLTLYYPPVGAGGGSTLLNVNVYLNQSTTAWNAAPIPLIQDDGQRGYKTIPIASTGVNFIQVGITYPTNIGINTIPTISYASIDYTPSTKII